MYVSIDVETTGLDLISDQIIEIGAIKFDEEKSYEEFSILINPNIPVPPEVTRITGITNNDLRAAPQLYEAVESLKNFIGDLPIIVHNAEFDIAMLKKGIGDLNNPHYDTLILSQLLIPDMRSYSLESLAKNLGIEHDQTHRALSDAKATALLFQTILRKIKNIDAESFDAIKPILGKTDWYGKNLFAGLKPKTEKPAARREQKTQSPQPNATPVSKKICEALKQNKKITFELSPRLNAEETAYSAAEEFASKSASAAPRNASANVLIALRYPLYPTILDKSQYLSADRFKKFLEKNNFEDKEAIFAIKIILEKNSTSNGIKEEFNLVREEHSMWEKICCDDFECDHNPKNCFYSRALEAVKNKKVIVVSHKTLLGDIKPADKLILCDFDEIQESASMALSIVFYSSRLKNLIDNEILHVKTEVIFGLLWRVVEQNSNIEEGKYAEIKIDESHKTTSIWQQIKGTALFMEEAIKKEKPSEFLNRLALLIDIILDKNAEYEMEVHRKYNEEIKVVLTPKNLDEMTEQKIFGTYENPVLIGSFDSADEKIKSDASPLEIFYLFEDLRKLNRDALFRTSTAILERAIIKNNGRTICVFHSKMSLRAAHETIYEEMKKRGISLCAQEISGGRGKIIDSYIHNPENSALFILEYYFKQLDLSELDFNQIIINKFYSGPDQSEQKFLANIKKVFNKILSAKKTKQILILDPFVVPLAEKIKRIMIDKIDIRVIKNAQLDKL